MVGKTAAAKPVGRTVAVGGREVPLTVKTDKRATRLTLRIEPGGRALKMTIPPNLPFQEVDNFLHRNHDWLRKKFEKLPQDEELGDGSSVTIRGEQYQIVRTGKLRGVTEAGEIGGRKVLFVGGAPEHLQRRIRDFLKKEAKADLERLVTLHAEASGKRFQSISYKDTKSRWGSCTHDGRLNFSWRIVMAPPFVIDYLAAHEVAHLSEMNHGPKFWALCRKLCPATDEAKAWLKQNGSALHAVEFG